MVQVDVLLGDVSWHTSYGLAGVVHARRVRADITLDWPTWAQTAYRSWYIGEPFEDPPEIIVEITLRIQRLAERPDPEKVLAVLPEESPPIGTDPLERSGPTIEQVLGGDLSTSEFAFEVSYEGIVPLEEEALADGSILDERFGGMGGWVASTLVKLGDLKLTFLPPEDDE
jgi:hypothetical protein